MNQFRKNILIICEGQETEPNYFYELRNIVIAKNLKVSVTISPPPPKESEVNPPFQLRQGGKKRLLKNSSKVISLDNVEDDFKEQPTRYVRAAQIKLKDKSYDEVWAVFDKDQHPDHQRAFEIANELIDDKIVQIAFTSIAFEYWILLHFEQNSIAFSKSMCRVGKDYFFCGENSHPSDCKGANCVCGRIVQQGYLKYHGNRKKFKFSEFNNRIETAILNSVHLANSYSNNTTPI